MNIEYINPFIEASQTVLQQVAGIEAKLGKVFLRTSPYKGESIVIMVGITGKMRGQTIFTMSKETAFRVASAMMGGMQVEELNEISKSALSELTNMILGNAATLLYNKGIGIEITPPSLLLGENLSISQSKMQTICIPLCITDTEILEIDLSVEN
ncbi:chemotaxis protein CheX [Ruminiclostridium herbifermentans]|uniref:Chemotaxis protein CheX n=1 Tax=Ruminiclostridium herbifermentans TaxID=2488810 RepID=A0A4V6YE36_9FIRM|nr:chemotaxis protein CheX [Ruminiclostridium herbifermentans]QNU67860.1 chemotaxis protein CheX [Ruminiclostridium herbifermentans]